MVKAAKSWTPDDPWAAAIVLVISVLVTALASSLFRLQQQQVNQLLAAGPNFGWCHKFPCLRGWDGGMEIIEQS